MEGVIIVKHMKPKTLIYDKKLRTKVVGVFKQVPQENILI